MSIISRLRLSTAAFAIGAVFAASAAQAQVLASAAAGGIETVVVTGLRPGKRAR